jgi:hypothetical protein
MPTLISELTDLAVLMAMICVPLGVGAIAIPLGRALAERMRLPRRRDAHFSAVLTALESVNSRLSALERTVDATAVEVERLSDLERNAPRAFPERSAAPRLRGTTPATPH